MDFSTTSLLLRFTTLHGNTDYAQRLTTTVYYDARTFNHSTMSTIMLFSRILQRNVWERTIEDEDTVRSQIALPIDPRKL